jgi:hypothetical protein
MEMLSVEMYKRFELKTENFQSSPALRFISEIPGYLNGEARNDGGFTGD